MEGKGEEARKGNKRWEMRGRREGGNREKIRAERGMGGTEEAERREGAARPLPQ